MGGKYNVLARLTLTYQDIFRRKHAATFDYIDLYGWQCVALLSDIAKDLEDVNSQVAEARYAAVRNAANVLVPSVSEPGSL